MTERKCRFCRSTEELSNLTTIEFKAAKRKVSFVTENDLFCKRCRAKIQNYVLKRNQTRFERRQTGTRSLSSSSPLSSFSRYNNTSSTVATSQVSNSQNIQTSNSERSGNQQAQLQTLRITLLSQSSSSSQSNGEFPSSDLIAYKPPSQHQTNVTSSQTSSDQQPPQQPISPVVTIRMQPVDESSESENNEPAVPISAEVPEAGSRALKNVQRFVRIQPVAESSESENDEPVVQISAEVPGAESRALRNVQPFVRRRRDDVVFPNESRIPRYNRKNFGG